MVAMHAVMLARQGRMGGDGDGAGNNPIGGTMTHQSDNRHFVMVVHGDCKDQGDQMIQVRYDVQRLTMTMAV
jgi:hypothetical protein